MVPELVNENVVNCEGSDWRSKYEESNKKYEELKKSYMKLSLRHSELLMKHDDLVKTATNSVRPNTDDELAEALSPSDNIFTPNEIKCLQSLTLEKKKDSTFILQCIEYAYKDTASTLLGKTLKGTLERVEYKENGDVQSHPAKDPLTPEKVKRIEELFIDRVSKCKISAVEFGERIKQTNINKLIAAAIKNVANKQVPHGMC